MLSARFFNSSLSVVGRRSFHSSQISLANTTKLLINGKFVESETKEWLDIRNPATQEIVTRVPLSTQAEMKAAVDAASAAFPSFDCPKHGQDRCHHH
eukprot:gene11531-13456_t